MPTLPDRVDPEMTVVKQESFGPISPGMRFKTIEDAIPTHRSASRLVGFHAVTAFERTSKCHLLPGRP